VRSRNRNAQVKGRVVRVVQEKGYCFVEPLAALPSGYILPPRKNIFLHRSANGGSLPSIGATGIFTIENRPEGIRAISVEWEPPVQEPTKDVGRFVHPYNFVSLPADGLGRAIEESVFQRRKYLSHERYDPQLHSGYIDCTLTAQTHWFIPHAEKSFVGPDANGHKVLGYFTLDAVSNWDHHDPTKDPTRPAIPASSLRGMVRSVFETATLSCLSIFDPGRLDFRIGRGQRLPHEHARGDLLHPDFHPCFNHNKLCPACRVFGWVREPTSEERLKSAPDQVDAVAGHIRFTHAMLRGEWGTATRRPEVVPLAILGSPKPTTTEFYLQPRADWEHARRQRWPSGLQNEQRLLYRQDEAVLRGRKFYRRRSTVNVQNDDPAQNGLRRPENTRGSQKQTIHILPSGLEFGFRVYFDNLHDEEFGALLFSLSLQLPEAWNQPVLQLRHALGHGKPLGMGACTIRIDALHLDDLDLSSPRHRYAQVPSYAPLPPVIAVPQSFGTTAWQQVVNRFGDAWQRAEALEGELKTTRRELIELLRADPPEGPMHYPPNPLGGHTENYCWFVQNRRGRGHNRQRRKGLNKFLPSPLDEREPQKRLPNDPTKP
jgi:hypothetical protein